MTVVTDVASGEPSCPPEPDLTPAEIIARAERIAPTLVERRSVAPPRA